MSDEWESGLFKPSFGGFDLSDVLLSTSDDIGRDTVVTTYPRRDGGHVDDQGGVPRSTTWSLLFYAYDGADITHIERFQSFVKLLDGEPRDLVHPITGTFTVRPGDISFDTNAVDRNQIPITVTFLEHRPEPAIFELGAGSPVAGSREDVQSAVDAVRIEATLQGLDEPTIADNIEDLAASWEERVGSLSSTAVVLQLNDAANAIETFATSINVATNLDRYPMLVALNRMRDSMGKMAEAVISAAPRLTSHRVRLPMPLLAISAELYGAEKAQARYESILELNRVPDPLRVPEGTILKIPES